MIWLPFESDPLGALPIIFPLSAPTSTLGSCAKPKINQLHFFI